MFVILKQHVTQYKDVAHWRVFNNGALWHKGICFQDLLHRQFLFRSIHIVGFGLLIASVHNEKNTDYLYFEPHLLSPVHTEDSQRDKTASECCREKFQRSDLPV